MKSKSDIWAAVIATIAIVGGGFSWLLTMENRLTKKANKESVATQIKDTKELLRKEINGLKTEMDTDIRILRDRQYQQQYHQPQPQIVP